MNLLRVLVTISLISFLTGCASLDSPSRSDPKPQPRVVQPAPVVPEIQAPRTRVIKPYAYSGAKVIKRRPPVVVKQKPKPKPRYQAPKYKSPKVQRYPGVPSKQIKMPSPIPMPVRSAPMVKEVVKMKEPEEVGLDIDPYANIPDHADDRGAGRRSAKISSPAVEALMVRAYADAKLGRTDAAMGKLERGLRIEPQNPKLWNQLAELHYKSGNYQQAITMAKKAINFSSNNQQMTNKNWQLISKVAKKSGDSRAMSEVNEYNKRR